MGTYYLDTSALAKRHVQETGTVWITRISDPSAKNELYTTILTGVELVAALFRKARNGEMTQPQAARATANFKSDWQTHYQIVEVGPLLVERAMDLAEKHGLRGYDATHLAAALIVQEARGMTGLMPLIFVSADLAQLQAAAAEGLAVEYPNAYP